jgi:tRNA-dihydrouridine synthase
METKKLIRREIPNNWYNQDKVMTVMAPMVGQSDIGFRLLCKKFGCSVCFSEMLLASRFSAEENYRIQAFGKEITDHPLVV